MSDEELRPPDHFLVGAFLAAGFVFLFALLGRVLPWLPLNRLPFAVRLSPLPTFCLDFLGGRAPAECPSGQGKLPVVAG